MNVWGFDPSSKCGLSIWDTSRHISSAHCEVIENTVNRDYYWYSFQMGRKLRARIKQFGKPDLVVIEQASESSQGTGINGIIWCWDCVGAISSFVGICGVPAATITSSAWRNPFYGRGFVPPQVPVIGKDKKQEVDRFGRPKFSNDWKAAAVNKCSELGIVLPSKKGTAHNAAEAVGIAHSWRHADIINKEFEPAFMSMLQNRMAAA